MKILLEAPILTQSGYGEHSKLVFKSICDTSHDIYVNPLKWGETSWNVFEAPEKLRDSIRKYGEYLEQAKSTTGQLEFDMQIHVGIPNEFEKKAPFSICVTAGIETDRVSSNWLLKTHQGIDKLIVPSNHAKSGFETTSYQIKNESNNTETLLECNCPISVVPYPVKTFAESEEIDLAGLQTDFNFLSVALLGPRKNLENLVTWFVEEFKDNPDVGLVLKTAYTKSSLMDRTKTAKALKKVLKKKKDYKCKVYLLHGSMTEQEIHNLYKHPKIKAYVTTTHGEGYGLPIFEAAYSGLPIIATDWSGHLDFLSGQIREGKKTKIKKLFGKINFDLNEVPKSVWWDHIIVKGSKWAVPHSISVKAQMRKFYKNHGLYLKWSKALKEQVLESHSEEKVLSLMREEILGNFNYNLNFSEENKEGEVIVL